LLDKVDLETNVIHDVRSLPWDRYDCDQVDKRDTTTSIVDEGSLTLLSGIEHPLQVGYGNVVRVLSLGAFDYLTVGA